MNRTSVHRSGGSVQNAAAVKPSRRSSPQTPPEAPLVKTFKRRSTNEAGRCRALTCACLRTARQTMTLYTHSKKKKKENARAARLARRRRKKNTKASNGAWSKETRRICASLHFRTVCFAVCFLPPRLVCCLRSVRYQLDEQLGPPRCDVRQPGHLPGSVSGETRDNKPDFAPGLVGQGEEKKTQRLVAELSAGRRMLPGPLGRKRTVAPTHWPDSARIH